MKFIISYILSLLLLSVTAAQTQQKYVLQSPDHKIDADRVWRDERDIKGMLGKHKSLIDQAAMIEIYARLIQMKGAKP